VSEVPEMKTLSRKTQIAMLEASRRLRVKVKELRAEIDAVRDQHKTHAHDVYEYVDYGSSHLETGQPK